MFNSKIHASLRKVLSVATATAAAEPEPIPVIVRYRQAQDVQVATAALDAVVTPRQAYEIIPCIAAEATPAEIQQLAAHPDVEQVWYDMPVYALLDVSVPHIRARKVWAKGDEGAGVRVAILDTGCDMKHPDLKGRIKAHKDFSGKGSAQDGNGHGTHVAGIIAGSGAASHGKYRGVAPKASLYIAKVLDDRGSGRMSNVMAGLDWAVSKNAQVVNLSLGSSISCDGSDALSEACDAAVSRGVVMVVAAGNNGPMARTVGAPGCARQVITIGASADNDKVASFSSRGPTSDGRVKPDVLLPGMNIISLRAAGTTLGNGQVNEYYTSLSGTSMAAPHAAGVAALLLAAQPSLQPGQVKEILKTTAVDLGLNSNTQGAGRVDAYAAWKMAKSGHAPKPKPTPKPPPPPPPSPIPIPEPPDAPSGCLNAALMLLLAWLQAGKQQVAKLWRTNSAGGES